MWCSRGGRRVSLVQAGSDPAAVDHPCFLTLGTSQPSTHPGPPLLTFPSPHAPRQTRLHATEASCSLPAVPAASSAGGGSPLGRQELPAVGVPRHSFSSCARSSGRELKAMRQRGQENPPEPSMGHPGSTVGWESPGGATLPGKRGPSTRDGTPGRAGTRGQTCSAAVVAAVFEATVATLGRAREGGRTPDPGHSHCLPPALERERKMSLGHLSNPQKTRQGRPR